MYIICIYLWVIHPKGRDLMQVFYSYLLSFLIHVEQLMVNFYRTTIHLYIFFVHWQTIPCFFLIFIIFLIVLGLCCCSQALSSCGEHGPLWLWCGGFSLWRLLWLQSTARGAGAQELRLTGLEAPQQATRNQGLSRCPLHRQVDS